MENNTGLSSFLEYIARWPGDVYHGSSEQLSDQSARGRTETQHGAHSSSAPTNSQHWSQTSKQQKMYRNSQGWINENFNKGAEYRVWAQSLLVCRGTAPGKGWPVEANILAKRGHGQSPQKLKNFADLSDSLQYCITFTHCGLVGRHAPIREGQSASLNLPLVTTVE